MWSRILKNEEAMARVGPQRHGVVDSEIVILYLNWLMHNVDVYVQYDTPLVTTIFQLPDDGYSRWSKHVGVQKRSLVE